MFMDMEIKELERVEMVEDAQNNVTPAKENALAKEKV